MNRRNVLKLMGLGCLPGITGCSESPHTYEEITTFDIDKSIPAGEGYVYTVSSSYTTYIDYSVNVQWPDEGYATKTPVNFLVVPETRTREREGLTSISEETLSNYFEEPTRFDITEDIEGTGTVPPGWNVIIIDNTDGETSVDVWAGGTLYRSKTNSPIPCRKPSPDGLEVARLNFLPQISGTYILAYHFRINSPASDRYYWTISAATKTAEASMDRRVDAECAAHFAGEWSIPEEDLNELSESGGKLKVEITAEGASDKYQTIEWIDLD